MPFATGAVPGVQLPISDSSWVLIVRHGPGRGRGPNFGLPFLEYLERSRPGLHQRLRIWRTGEALPSLDGVRAVLFWLADPLRELYPDCFEEATAIAERARALGLRLINAPEALSNTIKTTQSQRWQDAGLPAAPAFPFRDLGEFSSLIRTVRFPAIVRPDWLHSQEKTHFCRTARDATRLDVRRLAFPGVVLPFIDTRADYARTAPGSPWAVFFHKKRCFVFGNRVVSNHVYFSKQPIVGLSSSTFSRYRGGGRYLLPLLRVRPLDRAAIACDYGFWQQAPEASTLMLSAARAIDLDVIALDYSTRANGSIVLWEANPYFALDPWHQGVLPYHRRLEERITSFAAAYADFLEDQLGSSEAGS